MKLNEELKRLGFDYHVEAEQMTVPTSFATELAEIEEELGLGEEEEADDVEDQ